LHRRGGFSRFGAMSLIVPTNLTKLVEIAMPTNVATMEVRGVYGGFFVGTDFFFLMFARHDAWLRPALSRKPQSLEDSSSVERRVSRWEALPTCSLPRSSLERSSDW